MTETTDQMKARWAREQVADQAAVSLGLARQTKQHGIMYWTGNGEQFRAGYWAGREVPAAVAASASLADIWERSASDQAGNRDGAGEDYNQGVVEGMRICAADLRAALAATPALPATEYSSAGDLAEPSPQELMALSNECMKLPGGMGMHYLNYAKAVLARWGTTPQAQPADAPIAYLQESDQHLLHRYIETTEDDESFDIGKDAVKRLANLGVVESCGFGRYGVTMFGYWVHEHYWHQNPSLPLKTNADRDREHRAAMAAAQEGSKQ